MTEVKAEVEVETLAPHIELQTSRLGLHAYTYIKAGDGTPKWTESPHIFLELTKHSLRTYSQR